MPETVLAVFSNRDNAEMAIEDLQSEGYNPKDISIVMRDREEAEGVARDTGSNVAAGAVSGATTGGVVGAITGLLVGIGAIAIPGIGGVLIGGPLAAALGLTGAAATTVSGAATGAVAGGLIGALMGLGVPEEEARVYEERIKAGEIMIAVPTRGRGREVESILSDHGADQIRTVDMRERI
jgi:uncharacterized membrane protein